MRLFAFHQFADKMVNCGIFFVIFSICKSLVVEKCEAIADILTVHSRLFQTDKESFIFFRNFRSKQLLNKSNSLLTAVKPSPCSSERAPFIAKRRFVKNGNAPCGFSVKFKQVIFFIGYGITDGIRAYVKSEINFLIFHIDNRLSKCYYNIVVL